MKAYNEAIIRGEHPRPPRSVLEARKAAREWLKTHKKGKSKKTASKERGGKTALHKGGSDQKKKKMKTKAKK